MSTQAVASTDLQEWLGELLRSFRLRYETLEAKERRFVSSLDDLSQPCQIELIWFQSPNTQYVIATRFEDRRDMEIIVDGPFPTYDALDRLEQILQQPRWERPIESEPDNPFTLRRATNYRELLEDAFIGIMRDLGGLSFRKPAPKPIVGMKTVLTRRAALWYVRGNLGDTSPSEMVSETLDITRRQAEAARKTIQPPPSSVQLRPRIAAHGGYIFPPVWLGNPPKHTFREKVTNFPRFSEKVCEGTYKGRTMVAEQDGFLTVAEGDGVKATELLNEIMAVRLMSGKRTYAFREQEVGHAEIDPEGKTIVSKGVPTISPRWQLMEGIFGSSPWSLLPREVISIEEIVKWLSTAEKATQDPEMSESLRFLLEAFTHFENSEYKEAFVLAWVIIEKDLFSRWKRYMKEQGLSSHRRHKLEDPNNWSVDRVTETLSLAGQIPEEEYEKLMAMKSIRNDIIHEGQRVSKSQADQSLELAMKTAEKKMSLFS